MEKLLCWIQYTGFWILHFEKPLIGYTNISDMTNLTFIYMIIFADEWNAILSIYSRLTFTDMNACNFFWIKKQDLWNYIP